MATKKKNKEEDLVQVETVVDEAELSGTPALELPGSVHEGCHDASCENCNEKEMVPMMALSDIPTADLKELLSLLEDAYSRSNNKEFRLRCKRLQGSIGGFVGAVDVALNG